MDALKRAKSERAGHRGIVTKVFKEVQAFVANPVDSDDVQAVSQRLRDLQLCAQKLRREQEQLPALNLRFQAELTEEQELEADIVNADDLDTQLELNLLQLDDAISLLKPGSSLPPPRLSVSSPPPSVATDAQPGFTSADVFSVHVRLPKLTLPTFSGDPLDWQSFWDTFAASVHSNTSLSGVQKFQYLRGQLTGAAARCIAGLTATNQHYTHAVELLRQRFGQPHKITSAHMEALIHMAPPSASHRDLRSFFDRVSCHVRGLEAAGRTANSYGDCLVPILLERLPATTKQQLTRDHGTTEWEIGALLAALRKEIEILELGPSLDDATPQPTMNFATMARRGQRQGSASRSSRTPRCAFCDRPHPSSQCSTVTDPQQRRDTVKSKGLCFNCLGPHRVSTCPTKVRCRTCGQKHHTTLCMPQQPPTQRSHATVASSTAPQPQPDQPGQSAQPAQPTPASHVACATSVHPAACLAAGQSVILQTASTTVYAEQGNRSASVRLLLDSGSQRTYMSRRLAESLHLQPALHEPLSISTFGDTRPFTVDTYLVNFQLGLKDGSRLDVNANVIPDITGSIYRGSTPPEDEAFLRDLSPGMLADCLPSDQDDAKVDLLIGSDLFWDLVSSDRIVLPSGLLLLSSKLGYILTGKCNTAQPAKEVSTLIAHTPVLQSGLIPTYTACADSCVSSSPNLTDFWSLETIGIKDDPSPSPDDQIGQDFENSVRFEDGRYEVRWPWKDNDTDLPENFGLAFGRLKSLSRRFQQDPALLQRYDSVINDQLKKGIIELAPSTPPQPPIHYLPHQPVITPQKSTTKLRVVYDASSKTRKTDKSLNDCLHRGPVLLPDLCGLLIRFRLSPVVLLADIEKAFLQVGLHPADRDATRFLWFKDPTNTSTLDKNLAVYRFCRVPFGVISSPFLLQATIRHHLTNTEDPCAKDIGDNIYVDNLVLGLDSAPDAVHMHKSATSIFAKASMHLREWSTNSDVVRSILPDQPPHADVSVSVLGLRWNSLKDTFRTPCFRSSTSPVVTKREVLQRIAEVYDPLGMFTPVLLPGKLFLRRLWDQQLAWDEPLSPSLTEEWFSIAAKITPVADITLPRCPAPVTADSQLSLHVFTDASKHSYAAAVYLVVRTDSAQRAFLLYSKMRLAPQKTTSIPRLELLGVVIGVRAITFVHNQLHRHVESQHLWTDSRCVLFWITSPKRMSRFVENRLTTIREHPALTFHYVPTKDNPADLATRGTSALDLRDTSQWWNGPPWLSLTPSAWPQGKHPDVTPAVLEQAMQETAKAQPIHVHTMAARNVDGDSPAVVLTPMKMDPTRYSTLPHLHRISALCIRFLALRVWTRLSDLTQQALSARYPLLGHTLNFAGSTTQITAESIRLSTLWWIRALQQDQYADVITALQLKKTHPLARQLHLRLDGFNILRCHSRLANADLSFDTKCPILLPRKTPFATLVVLDIHRRLLHSGVSHTLSELQRTYWLCHGRAEVRRILSSCIICKRHEGPAFRLPPMPALTKERVTRSRPFQFVGLDYLGPLVVNDRGERVKVWICLFTCLAVRAIHLECATGLSSAQFLACLRRFVARRGCPDQIICDNAPQFKLARTTLERQWDHRVASHAADNNITWHFITEHAPWQGGFYERLVGLCKRALRKSINRRLLHLSDLTTLVTEVEATLNSRPLTYVDGGVTITPAHFLSLSPAPRLSLPSGADVAETADAQLYLPATDPAEELRRTWQASMTTLEYFWSIWEREYLQLLRQTTISRQHHQHSTVNRTPQVNDIVIVKSDEQPRASWKLGRVMAVNQSHDTLIRSARVLMPNHRVLTRPVNQLFPLELHCVSQPAPAQPAPDSTSSAATRPARSAALDAQRRLADLFCDTSS